MAKKKFGTIVKEALVGREFVLRSASGHNETFTFLDKTKTTSKVITKWEVLWFPQRSSTEIHISGNSWSAKLRVTKRGILEGNDAKGGVEVTPTATDVQQQLAKMWSSKTYVSATSNTLEENTVVSFFQQHTPLDWSEELLIVGEAIPVPAQDDNDLSLFIGRDNVSTKWMNQVKKTKGPVSLILDRPTVEHESNEKYADAVPDRTGLIVTRSLGDGLLLIHALTTAFERGYQSVYVQTDEVLGKPSAPKICRNLHKWATKTYENVGVSQIFTDEASWPQDDQDPCEVGICVVDWNGFVISRECWDLIKDEMTDCAIFFTGASYESRPHTAILHWLRNKIRSHEIQTIGNNFPRLGGLTMHGRSWTVDQAITQFAVNLEGSSISHILSVLLWTKNLDRVAAKKARVSVDPPTVKNDMNTVFTAEAVEETAEETTPEEKVEE